MLLVINSHHHSIGSVSEMENEQDYNLTFEMRDGYLYAHLASSSMSLELAKRYIKEISDKRIETGSHCVIIDRHCPNTLSNAMSYLAISELCELAPTGFRMGIVDADEENRRHLNFGLRSLERDDIHVQIFEDVTGAEAWLATEKVCE